MKCNACNGSGKNAKGGACFLCEGHGELCDRCGEATLEPGRNVCEECEADEKSERERDD